MSIRGRLRRAEFRIAKLADVPSKALEPLIKEVAAYRLKCENQTLADMDYTMWLLRTEIVYHFDPHPVEEMRKLRCSKAYVNAYHYDNLFNMK